MSLITTWDNDSAAGFGKAEVSVRHGLHQRAMFDDASLAALLDRYPRDQLGVFTMGEDPVDWRTWRRGEAGALSGAELLAEVRAGRLWLNLRRTNDAAPEYAALSDEIFGEIE